jgi:type I restriction enzyme, S subunit
MSHETPLLPLHRLVKPDKPITYGILMPGPDIEDGVPYVRVLDMKDGVILADQVRRTSTEIARQYSRSAIAEGDILLSIRGHVGRVAVVPASLSDANITQDTARLSINGTCDRRYVFWYLQSPAVQRWMKKHTKGGAVKGINLGDVKELTIPVPLLPTQHRIADILDKADAIRRKREEGIRLTEELLRSTFLEMFGDPATNPKGWARTPLGDQITFMTSGSRGWAAHYANQGTRFVRSLDVQMNRIGEDDPAFVNPPNSSESERTRVQDGDVLLTITGSKVGRATFVPEGFGPAYVSQHVAILRLDGRIRPRFLSMFLADELGGQRLIKAAQYGQTKPGLNLEQIRAFSIPCPPLRLQDRFVALWRQWDRIQVQRSNSVAAARNLFESLVQHAFRGEL